MPEDADSALKTLSYAPQTVQKVAAHALASPRVYNLVVSNIPGPRIPMYLRGCRLHDAYPVVPLSARHALSVGMTTIGDHACFGLYADPETLPDSDPLARDLDDALDELRATIDDPWPTPSRPRFGIGDPVPPFSLPDTDGVAHAVPQDPAPAATVIAVTCNHCPHVIAWNPHIRRVAEEYGERGVRFLAINANDASRYPADSLEAMQRFVRDQQWPIPYLHDEAQDVARALGAAGDAAHLRARRRAPARLPRRAGLRARERRVAARRARRRARGHGAGRGRDPPARVLGQVARLNLLDAGAPASFTLRGHAALPRARARRAGSRTRTRCSSARCRCSPPTARRSGASSSSARPSAARARATASSSSRAR